MELTTHAGEEIGKRKKKTCLDKKQEKFMWTEIMIAGKR